MHAENACRNATLSTECVMDLDSQNKKIIFVSILITFQLSVVFRGSWGSSVNWLEPRIEPPLANLACPNP